MQPKIGIMQGRLLPKVDKRYQCFPAVNWQKEFYLAKKLGLNRMLLHATSISFKNLDIECSSEVPNLFSTIMS